MLSLYKPAYEVLMVEGESSKQLIEEMGKRIQELTERVEMYAIKPETEKFLKELAEMYKNKKL